MASAASRWLAWSSIAWLVAVAPVSASCPFCAAVSQTLRQEIEAMDGVAIAKFIPPGKGDKEVEGQGQFEILEVLKGNEVLQKGAKVYAPFFGTAGPNSRFLLLGVDPPELLWSSPLPLSDRAVEYVQQLQKLPTDNVERLKFFQGYFEDQDSLLARDAYDEFANASYAEVKALKPLMNREQLLKWISDTNLGPDRKRLYLTMLGICGDSSDADMLEEAMKSKDQAKRAGLDAMIGCYLTLKKADGLPLIEELFLRNKKCDFADVYAAIMALRFHGTDGGVIDRSRIVQSMQFVLDRPELADLVIPDLARWEDWTQIDRLVTLFKQADENTSWVRVPVINYLRSCPLPVAKERLKELEQIDPVAAKRAATFFPAPTAPATPAKTDSSRHAPARISFGKPVMIAQAHPVGEYSIRDRELAGHTIGVIGTNRDHSDLEPANPWVMTSVAAMAGSSLWMVMWLTISGTGTPGPLSRILRGILVNRPRS